MENADIPPRGRKRRGATSDEVKIYPTPLGQWLANAMELRGSSAYDLSKRSGVTHAAISQILSGKSGRSRGHDRDTIERLARGTMPDDADELNILHHINRGLVANNMLPMPVRGGSVAVVREGQPPQYLPGASPDHVTTLRTGETVETFGTGKRFVLTEEFIERIELEAELVKRRGQGK